MRILHLNGYFKEDLAYQENFLTIGQLELGHEVILISSRYEPELKINKLNRKRPAGETIYKGIRVIRVDDYFELKKNALVLIKNILPLFKRLNPDIIFFHDVSPSLFYGVIYKWINPRVKLHIDFHSDEGNARSSFIGPLYHFFWKLFFYFFGNFFERYFCVAPEAVYFVNKYYSISIDKLIHLPLMGDSNNLFDYEKIRNEVRNKFKLNNQNVSLVHTGKMPEGKETLLLLKSFVNIKNKDLRLFIIGSIHDDFSKTFIDYLEKDDRIAFLGWLNPEEMRRLFCGFDLMIQPGSNSHIFIEGICCGLPILLNDTPQARSLTSMNNGEVLTSKTVEVLSDKINEMIAINKLEFYRKNAFIAANYYHYKTIAKISLA
jgi:1,2-diacylglycerol 3-alpha-glucosyltransferase